MLLKRRVVQLFSMPKPECYMYVMFVSKCSFHVKEKKVVVRKKKQKTCDCLCINMLRNVCGYKKKEKKRKRKKEKRKKEKVCVSKHVEPVNLLNLNFTFGVYLFICWRIAAPLLANICSSVGEYLFLCWCISVPLLMYISASVGVYLFTCCCLSVHLLLSICSPVLYFFLSKLSQ